jgi:two-component system response regulator AtoC
MKVLIVDDDPGLRDGLSRFLKLEGYNVVAQDSPVDALDLARQSPFDLILCDVRMPDMDGSEFLRRYKEGGGAALVIMMSAYGSEDAAIEAMKRGAYDYLSKPFRPDEVTLTLRKAQERERLRDQVASLEAELSKWRDRDLVAQSPAMRRVLELAARVAPHTTTVLVTGESGTGKEVLARKIHAMSPRCEGPFVALNCGAIPESLLESELFGHAKGAFTGATSERRGLYEEADGGTLLLDEIGDLPVPLQVKLLRVLQEGEIRPVGHAGVRKVDVRVVAATARDLEQDVEAGQFREDLYYRLNVIRIHVPPLRERPEDLEPLVFALFERSMERTGRRVTVTPDVLAAICQRSWPGNVRELENAIERAVVLSHNSEVPAEAFAVSAEAPSTAPNNGQNGQDRGPLPLKVAVSRAEREAIQAALNAAGRNRAEAAKILGVSIRSLFYKLKQHAI